MLSQLWKLKTNVDSGQFDAIQLAAARVLGVEGDAHVAHMRDVYRRRRDLVIDALGAAGLDVTPPRGTIYVWVPVPQGHTSVSFAELVLQQADVVVSPGSAYGPNGEGFFRISLTVPDERLLEAVQRMRASLGG